MSCHSAPISRKPYQLPNFGWRRRRTEGMTWNTAGRKCCSGVGRRAAVGYVAAKGGQKSVDRHSPWGTHNPNATLLLFSQKMLILYARCVWLLPNEIRITA